MTDATLLSSSYSHYAARALAARPELAERIAAHVTDGALIGIGSGSATYMALWSIGQRVRRESLSVRLVTSSYETALSKTPAPKAMIRPT